MTIIMNLLLATCFTCLMRQIAAFTAPTVSFATGLPNKFYQWKHGQKIRFQEAGPEGGQPVLLIHGLFSNSDHWRKTIPALADAGYKVYAIDMWGWGYSDKPASNSEVAKACCGEVSRFDKEGRPDVLHNVVLSTPRGVETRVCNIELRHPLRSPYNFYTWSDLITDFTQQVINAEQQVTLVTNSVGANSALQAVIDTPDLFAGVFATCPTFRELHSAEMPCAKLCMPVLRAIQMMLQQYGQVIFDALAKPETVKQILQVPYAVKDAVDNTLVKVLLDQLLTPGASRVIFDFLSYSAGPISDQQLASFPANKPVWLSYGTADPWTSGPRVEALKRLNPAVVERVVALDGVGHCPHDEAPQKLNKVLFRFLRRLQNNSAGAEKTPAVTFVR